MEWLFDGRGKSVAKSAQRVVSDMHRHIEKQNAKIDSLELIITKFQHLSKESVEKEIERLELKKRKLSTELEATDVLIKEMKEKLISINIEVAQIISGRTSIEQANSCQLASPNYCSLSETNILALEEKYLEESEMLSSLREIDRMLFIVHRNNVKDTIIYTCPENHNDFVKVSKIMDISNKSKLSELTSFENIMAYGVKVIPNHERDFPEVVELAVPPSLHTDKEKDKLKSPHNKPVSNPKQLVGQLVTAFEIPITPGVAIDVWQYVDPTRKKSCYWVTTSIDHIGFALLERMFVTSVTSWGVQTVTQVDLFGRHPLKGHILMESVTASGE